MGVLSGAPIGLPRPRPANSKARRTRRETARGARPSAQSHTREEMKRGFLRDQTPPSWDSGSLSLPRNRLLPGTQGGEAAPGALAPPAQPAGSAPLGDVRGARAGPSAAAQPRPLPVLPNPGHAQGGPSGRGVGGPRAPWAWPRERHTWHAVGGPRAQWEWLLERHTWHAVGVALGDTPAALGADPAFCGRGLGGRSQPARAGLRAGPVQCGRGFGTSFEWVASLPLGVQRPPGNSAGNTLYFPLVETMGDTGCELRVQTPANRGVSVSQRSTAQPRGRWGARGTPRPTPTWCFKFGPALLS